MTTPVKWGVEFQVNTTANGVQWTPTVTGLADGRFVIAWEDDSQTGGDTSQASIRAQILNADGTKSGSEFLVNTTTAGAQDGPTITALADGRFAVAWTDFSNTGGDTSSSAIRAQVFNGDGSPSGAEFLVNTAPLGFQFTPVSTALADGRFVVAWADGSLLPGDTSGFAVRAQIINADGSKSGSEFQINTASADDQANPTIAAFSDGRFVAAWTDNSATGGDTSSTAVRAQMYNADGTRSGTEILVNTATVSGQDTPSITVLANGRFVVAWQDQSQVDSFSDRDLRGQVFNENGTKFGTEFAINTFTPNPQYLPKLTALADGRFVAVWQDYSDSGDFAVPAVEAQMFDADGSVVGSAFRINAVTPSKNDNPVVAALADGRFVVTWTAFHPNAEIDAQIIDPRETAVHLNGTLANDSYVGTIFADLLSGWFGDDTLAGGGGDDNLFGSFGADVLNGNFGNDQMDGGDGNDTLVGGFGSDGLTGGAGDDSLNGGVGADGMVGGAGNDTYTIDLAGDLVVEAVGEGTDTVKSQSISLDLTNYLNVENGELTGIAGLALAGSNDANQLIGNAGNNVLTGRNGNDTIDGAAGNDFVFGGADNDLLTGGAGLDAIAGGDGNDTINGGSGVDTLTGDSGADLFVFATAADIGQNIRHDHITDFTPGEDLIDLHAILAGQTFIGGAAFTTGVLGQVRYVKATGLLIGDLNGDKVADYVLELDNHPTITAVDLVL